MVDSHDARALQSRLDQVLKKSGSVADLARVIGVSDNAIYKWLSGRGQPSVSNLVALADAAKVSIEWLATGHGAPVSKRSAVRRPKQSAFAYVARYDLKAPGPHGDTLRSEQIVDYLAF